MLTNISVAESLIFACSKHYNLVADFPKFHTIWKSLETNQA